MINANIKVTKYGNCLGTLALSSKQIKRLMVKGYKLAIIDGQLELRK